MQTRRGIFHGHRVDGADPELPQRVLIRLGVGLRPVHVITCDENLHRAVSEKLANGPIHARPVPAGDDGDPNPGTVQIPDGFS